MINILVLQRHKQQMMCSAADDRRQGPKPPHIPPFFAKIYEYFSGDRKFVAMKPFDTVAPRFTGNPIQIYYTSVRVVTNQHLQGF